MNSFILADEDPKTKKPVEMSTSQVTAALGLLKKALPDLQSIEMLVEDNRSLSDYERAARLDEITAALARDRASGTLGAGIKGQGKKQLN